MNTGPTLARRQRGIALLTAMFVVALATIAAVAMFESGNIAVRRASNLVETETAWWYAEGVESWVKGILKQDAKLNQIDSLADIWAKPIDFLPIDNGSLRGHIEDLQGRFNLNNLAIQNPEQLKIYLTQFQRLLVALPNVEGDKYIGVAAAVRDWVDSDNDRYDVNGAEDNEYESKVPAYRASNRPMQSVTELLQIQGVTRELYEALRPYVAVLPIIGTKINVNTAPVPVLESLSANFDKAALEEFVKARMTKPAMSPQEVLGGGANTFLLADETTHPETLIDVRSQFFQLQAEVLIGSSRVALYSVYARADGGNPIVIAHSTETE